MNVCVILLILSPALVAAQFTCAGKSDGAYEIGCQSFTTCTNGVLVHHYCDLNHAYDKATGTCQPLHVVGSPCGLREACTGKANGHYAGPNHCSTFYTCSNGINMGHIPCPGGLVFNSEIGDCDSYFDVKKPCGAKPA